MCTCHVLKCQLMSVIIKKLNIKITTIYWFYNNIQLHIIFVLVELGCPKGCMFRQLKKIIIIQTFIMFLPCILLTGGSRNIWVSAIVETVGVAYILQTLVTVASIGTVLVRVARRTVAVRRGVGSLVSVV